MTEAKEKTARIALTKQGEEHSQGRLQLVAGKYHICIKPGETVQAPMESISAILKQHPEALKFLDVKEDEEEESVVSHE